MNLNGIYCITRTTRWYVTSILERGTSFRGFKIENDVQLPIKNFLPITSRWQNHAIRVTDVSDPKTKNFFTNSPSIHSFDISLLLHSVENDENQIAEVEAKTLILADLWDQR